MENNLTIKITPARSWLSVNFKELWEFREVFYLLVWRDLKVRYKQTALGVFWVILQPIIATAIFTAIFTRFARFESGATPYPLLALSGFAIWMFVNTAVSQASISLVYHEQLVTKIYFPRMIVPAASVISGIPDMLLSVIILIAAMLFYGFVPGWKLAFVPLFLILAVVVALAVSLLLAALNVRFRDIKFVIPFGLQVWMFGSPVFYPSSWLPEYLRPVFALNPVAGALDGLRFALFESAINWNLFAISTASAFVLILLSLFVFRKLEDDFADLL